MGVAVLGAEAGSVAGDAVVRFESYRPFLVSVASDARLSLTAVGGSIDFNELSFVQPPDNLTLRKSVPTITQEQAKVHYGVRA